MRSKKVSEVLGRNKTNCEAAEAMISLHGFVVDWESVEQAPTETIVNVAAQICPFDPAAKQAMLEAVTLEDRSQALLALLEWDRAAGDDQQRPIQ